jgi:hypothetical protein
MGDPDEVVAAIRAAGSDAERIEIERAAVTDTAEEEPGEVEHGHEHPDGRGRQEGRG